MISLLKKFYKYVDRGILYFINIWITLQPSPKIKSGVCIIRLDAIGDFVLWLDSAKEYRLIYPDQKITLVANDLWADFAKNFNYWDEVIALNTRRFHKNIFYRCSFMLAIRGKGFYDIIQPTYSRAFEFGDSIVLASGSPSRIGSSGDLSNTSYASKKLSDTWYTKILPATNSNLMELDRNAEFTRNLSGGIFEPSIPFVPPLANVKGCFRIQGSYFLIYPGNPKNNKRWATSNYCSLLNQIQSQYDLQPILCGSFDEYTLCQEVRVRSGGIAINMAGDISLAESVELIRGAELVIGNDSSPCHIASSVGTPSVAIVGGGQYGRFFPYPDRLEGVKPLVANFEMECYQCHWKCNMKIEGSNELPCISKISVSNVLSLVNSIFNSRH